jgi:hypothetical protein
MKFLGLWTVPSVFGLLLGTVLLYRATTVSTMLRGGGGNGRRRLYRRVLVANETMRLLIQSAFLVAAIYVHVRYGNLPLEFEPITVSLVSAVWLTMLQSGLALWSYRKDARLQLGLERRSLIMKRPAEVTTAVLAAVLGAITAIVEWGKGGFDVTHLSDLAGPIILVVGFVPTLVTLIVAAKQRAGELWSDAAGEVQSAPPPAGG